MRTYLAQTYAFPEARTITSEPFQQFIHVDGVPLMEELLAIHRTGASPRSARAQQSVVRFMEAANALSGTPLTPEVPDLLHQIAEEEATSGGPTYDEAHGRYIALVGVINTGTAPEAVSDPLPYAWIADAMEARPAR
ncbi:hypothetical protein [Streptomyces olivaceus]|uniref:hypothetical protein n=1 Tax=Streptomyces olivaceus TaxID=47716 RepID=UPI001CCEA6D7|nr:hypothetical protein [Streptomyces olivaceus]